MLEPKDIPQEHYEKWDKNPLRYRFGIAAVQATNIGLLTAGLVFAPALAGFGAWGMGIALSVSVLDFAVKQLKTGKQPYDSKVKELIRDASEEEKESLSEVFKRAAITENDLEYKVFDLNLDDYTAFQTSLRTKMFHDNAAIVQKSPSTGNKNIVLVGQGAFEALSSEESEAIMAHETSHIVNQHSRVYNELRPALVGTYFYLGIISVFTLNPTGLALSAAAILGNAFIDGIARKIDEFRADYNSAGLYPAPDHLTNGIDKLLKLQRERYDAVPRSKASKIFQKVTHALFAQHPPLSIRRHYHGKCVNQAQQFYQKLQTS